MVEHYVLPVVEWAHRLLLHFSQALTFLHLGLPPLKQIGWANPEIAHLAPSIGIFVGLAFFVTLGLRELRLRELLGESQSVRMSMGTVMPAVLLALGITGTLYAAAGPSLFEVKQEIEYERACVGVALDVSRSVNAGTIVNDKPVLRLDQALTQMEALTFYFKDGSDLIGLMKFADAVIESPIFSNDFNNFRERLKRISYEIPQTLGKKGSDIIGAAGKMLEMFPGDVDCQHFAFLFTDGEQNLGGAPEEADNEDVFGALQETMKKLRTANVYTFMVVIGDPGKEENIFEFEKGEVVGVASSSKTGEFIRTTPNLEVARKVAEIIGAKVIVASDEALGAEVAKAIESERKVKAARPVSTPWSIAPHVAFLSLLFFFLGLSTLRFRR